MLGTASASFRALVLPKEHGSWSFAFEPVALGLLVAPSRPGALLAFAVLAGFFSRRPLKLAVTLPAHDPRRRPALPWAILWSALALAGIGVTAMIGSWAALWPLLLCVPFGAIFLWFDLRNVMREAEAEISGSAAFALLPATFATLAGWNSSTALGLAALMLTRSLPTVLTVRTYVRRAKGQPVHPTGAFAAAGAAFAIISVLALNGIVPIAGCVFAGVLFARTLIFLILLRPSWPAKRIGQCEAVLGVLCLVGFALGYHYSA